MCGILAVYLRNEQKNIDIIMNSYNMLINRGPDAGQHLIKNRMFFGFRRLAIMDMSSNGEQPFHLDDISMMCNGEIFNHEHLKYTYNLTCKSKSDCECIIHLYNKMGFDTMINALNGDFALVINDPQFGKVWFGRDRIGVRPLFYGFTKLGGNFAVSSYARALQDFCFDVKQVPPGWGYYDIISGEVVLYNYLLPSSRILTEEISTQLVIKDTLEKAVEERLMSNRPIGCLLSGGLDSSLITSILCRLIGPEKVRTYSIGMEGSNDLLHARETANYLKTQHTEVIFTPEEGFPLFYRTHKIYKRSYDLFDVIGNWLN